MAKDSTQHDYRRWAARRSTEALAALVAEHAGRCAQARLSGRPYSSGSANLLRDDHGVPQTINLKLDVAAHALKRRHQGRETYSPTGENSI